MAMEQDEFATWAAFFKIQDERDRLRFEAILRALGAKI